MVPIFGFANPSFASVSVNFSWNWSRGECYINCLMNTRQTSLTFVPEYLDFGGVYMRKLAPARVSHRDDISIPHRVSMMTGSFHISLIEDTLHVDKIDVWFKIANITHALPVPIYRQINFTPKRVVVSRLHDTVVKFRTGVTFFGTDPGSSQCYVNAFNGKLMGFRIKIIKKKFVCLLIVFCLFIHNVSWKHDRRHLSFITRITFAKMLANFIQFLPSISATSEFYLQICVTTYSR